MTTTQAADKTSFYAALVTAGRSPEIPESADAYGWLIGSWELEAYVYQTEGGARGAKGEVHFGWTLEGRAVQDVWIVPRRSERIAGPGKGTNLYGTTLRVWDPAMQAWRVRWNNPVTGKRNELVGRWSGKDVDQDGTHDGTPIRWTFTEITADSFHSLGDTLEPDVKTWKLRGEFRARRMR